MATPEAPKPNSTLRGILPNGAVSVVTVQWYGSEAIEDALFSRIQDLFALSVTVTLYDLTNTYFEGTATGNTKAALGRSKEKRSDCRLVTLGIVLDGSGFVRRSKMFA